MIDIAEIFSIPSRKVFERLSLKMFRYQYEQNPVYAEFCGLLKKSPLNVKSIKDIPFLPVEFFKSHQLILSGLSPEVVFTSSGTTGSIVSRHPVSDLSVYRKSYLSGFSIFYGDIRNYVVLALLPSYQQREGSSLIYMVQDLIEKSENTESGFHLDDLEALADKLVQLDAKGQNILLIGVTYALLDLIELRTFKLFNTIIMETGGMKGRRKEMIRPELHQVLCDGFGVDRIHSEYGMTELLSQAYSFGNGLFQSPPWMKVLIRETEDPLNYAAEGKTGGVNIIDLANVNSCAFIATQDLGRLHAGDQFEILGRFDHADIRGCNLMVM